MRPLWWWVGSSPLLTHGFFVLLGTCAALIVCRRESRRRDMLDDPMLWIVVGALISGALGAKLSTLWHYLAVTPETSVPGFLVAGGRSILGGLAGAYAGVLVMKRIVGYREPTGDVFAPAVALGMAIGRWGCFFTELPGTPTHLPWAVSFFDGVPRHPSFLYEIVFQLGMFTGLWWLRPRVRTKGDLFKIYLAAYAVFRFIVEFVRGNEVVWGGLTRPQLFLIPAALALLFYFAQQLVRGSYRPRAACEAFP